MDLSSIGAGATSTLGNPFGTARKAGSTFADVLKGSSSAPAASAGASCDSPAQLQQLQSDAQNSLSEFQRTLTQLFSQHGIDTSEAIRLESDGLGGVRVADSHPDQAAIEQLFKDNPDLAAKFQELSKKFNQLQTAQQGPTAGPPLFRKQFNMTFLDEDAKVSFA